MPDVAVVTDTTHYLPRALLDAAGVQHVSLYVNEGERTEREAAMADFGAFYARMGGADVLPTTSQPSIGDFLEVYEPLLAAGRDIVSIHLSGAISGTVASAQQAAADALARHRGRRVDVVDSVTTCGGLGAVVLGASAVARAGGDAAAVRARAEALRDHVRIWFAVDTQGRAFERMVDFLRDRRDAGATAWMVQHIRAPEQAERLVERGRELFGTEPLFVSEIGPVIGAHAGPGLLGVSGVEPR